MNTDPHPYVSIKKNKVIWSDEQVMTIARRIAARHMCSVALARDSLYALMHEGRLNDYNDAYHNTEPLTSDDAHTHTDNTPLRGHGKANRNNNKR